MSDPIQAAFTALHQGNLLAAKDARIKQLEAEVLALSKELAEAQENYHLVNEAVAKMIKANG